uniref:Store-operated calcium entry-associated regulatory factor n=1 Tax=Monodelphis domestica TaxID=13616 RepID=A0A5F8HEE2_MONDO
PICFKVCITFHDVVAGLPCLSAHSYISFSLLGHVGKEKILLRDIQALTLHRDRFTTARRTAPIPQLQCLGGSAGCPAHIPEIVQCRNKGWDGFDVQWECKAELDTSYRFGKTAVSCEGYDYPDDPYVLRGSCGLEFNLELTEQGRKKYKDAGSNANSHGNTYGSNYFPGIRHTRMGLWQFFHGSPSVWPLWPRILDWIGDWWPFRLFVREQQGHAPVEHLDSSCVSSPVLQHLEQSGAPIRCR